MKPICDICKTELEPIIKKWTSRHYKNEETPICDPCLEKFKNEEEQNRIQKRLLAIPPRYRNASLNDSPIPLNGNESVYFFSKTPGTGKTHLAWAFFLHHFKDENKKVLFSTFGQLQLRLRRSFDSENDNESKIFQEFKGADVVILDDVGGLKASEASDYSLFTVFEILNERYSWERQTILTSNKSLEDLELTFDARIASRIAGWCKVIDLEGKDRRLEA